MTKITVVIATHNSERWIIEALESVRAQTYPRDRIETIVVDDSSSDASASLARWFLVRHDMEGAVLLADRRKGIGAAMNLGWQAAGGDWIQFIKGQDLLAPDKIEIQANLVPELPENVRVICSSWQRMRLYGDQWQVEGPVNPSKLAYPAVLELVTPRPGRLGASLFRKDAIETVAGFSEEATFEVEEHFMLKMAGSGEGAKLWRRRSGPFVEAPSSSPLFFEREGTTVDSRHWKVGYARQHIENILVARAMLREHQGGMLTPENVREIAVLCADSLRDLREHDRGAFKQCSQWLREIDPTLLMVQIAGPRSNYHEKTHLIAPTRGRSASGSTALVSTMHRGERSLRIDSTVDGTSRLAFCEPLGRRGAGKRRRLAGPAGGKAFLPPPR